VGKGGWVGGDLFSEKNGLNLYNDEIVTKGEHFVAGKKYK